MYKSREEVEVGEISLKCTGLLDIKIHYEKNVRELEFF